MIFRIVQVERAAGDRRWRVEHHLAQCGESTPADSRKLMKPIESSPRCSCRTGE
jgi:hypothetical protein